MVSAGAPALAAEAAGLLVEFLAQRIACSCVVVRTAIRGQGSPCVPPGFDTPTEQILRPSVAPQPLEHVYRYALYDNRRKDYLGSRRVAEVHVCVTLTCALRFIVSLRCLESVETLAGLR